MSKIDDMVLHFTNGPGFLGIIESNCLRSTHFAYTNDFDELRIYFDSISATTSTQRVDFVEKIEEQNGGTNITISEAGLRKFVSIVVQGIEKDYGAYITSFCKINTLNQYRDGLLSQWRGYAGDGGYALEFSKSEIEKALRFIKEDGIVSIPCDVKYVDPSKIGKEIEKSFLKDIEACERTFCVDDSVKTLMESIKAPKEDLYVFALMSYYLNVLHACVRYKNHHFLEEQEWRVGSSFHAGSKEGLNNIDFFNREGTVTPYIEILSGDVRRQVRRVIVGPHPHQNRRIGSAKMFLAKHACEAEVVGSTIPFTRFS